MARYRIGFTKTAAAAAGFLCQLRAGTGRDLRLYEIGIFNNSTVAAEVGLVRPTNVGGTFTSTAVGAAMDISSIAGVAVVDTAASTAPTVGTNYMGRYPLAAGVGNGFILPFPSGITIPTSGSLALQQLSAGATVYDIYFEYDE